MPREITFKIGSHQYNVSPVRIDRRRLYGWTELIDIDDCGNPCDLLAAAGSDTNTVPEVGLSERICESGFETVSKLAKRVAPEQYLDYNIVDFYELKDPSGEFMEAVGDEIYIFQYTCRDSDTPSPAFVMTAGRERALFLLIGVKNIYEMLRFGDRETMGDRLIGEPDFSLF